MEEELTEEQERQGHRVLALVQCAIDACDGDPKIYASALLDAAAFGLRDMGLSSSDAVEMAVARISRNFEIFEDVYDEYPELCVDKDTIQ